MTLLPRRPRSAEADVLPLRGPRVRELGLPLPAGGESPVGKRPRGLSLVRRGRPLKRWRYVGAFGPELMLCAGDARVGPLRQSWWALTGPRAPLAGKTSPRGAGLRLESLDEHGLRLRVEAAGVRVELELRAEDGPPPIEVASPSGPRGWIWTRKRAGVPARGHIERNGRVRELALDAVIDDSAGYHERHTTWSWSTGVGRAESGERVAWNLVCGVHDGPGPSERTLWVDGEPREVGPVRFADRLDRIELPGGGRLEFSAWSAREHRSNLLLLRNSYRQPFGTFCGELPGGLRLAEGYGVMEKHDAWW